MTSEYRRGLEAARDAICVYCSAGVAPRDNIHMALLGSRTYPVACQATPIRALIEDTKGHDQDTE